MPQHLLPFSPTAYSLEISTYILPGKGKPRSQVGLMHVALLIQMVSEVSVQPVCSERHSGELRHPGVSFDTCLCASDLLSEAWSLWLYSAGTRWLPRVCTRSLPG